MALGLADLGSCCPPRDERARLHASRRPLAVGLSKSEMALNGAVADRLIAILFAAFLQRKLDDHHPVSNVKTATRLKTGFRVKGSYAREGVAIEALR